MQDVVLDGAHLGMVLHKTELILVCHQLEERSYCGSESHQNTKV
jgi:hypothetical protein